MTNSISESGVLLMHAGDVLLFHRPTTWSNLRRDPLGTFMTLLIHVTTRSKWNHAALASSPIHYIEATSEGVIVSSLWSSDDEILVIPVQYDDEEDRLTAVAWADARLSKPYGYWNAFMCGLNNVLAGLNLAIKRTDTIICSELVAEALERAGFDFGKDSSQVSPGDLATAFGVER